MATPRSVLVTGANRGLGLELVRQLLLLPLPQGAADPGPRVLATCRDPDGAGAQALRELASAHPQLTMLQLEVTSQESVAALALAVEKALAGEGLNVLINNAGVELMAPLGSVKAEDMTRNYNVDVVAPLMITQALLPQLRIAAERNKAELLGWGRAIVVNISSMMGSLHFAALAPTGEWGYSYPAAKAALNMVTRCLLRDLQTSGVFVVSVDPGWVKTDMGGPEAPLTPQESVAGMLRVLATLTPEENGGFYDHEHKPVAW
ncbi:C-signal-like [Lampetra fluviatilis]